MMESHVFTETPEPSFTLWHIQVLFESLSVRLFHPASCANTSLSCLSFQTVSPTRGCGVIQPSKVWAMRGRVFIYICNFSPLAFFFLQVVNHHQQMVNFALYLSYRCSHFVLLGKKKTKQKYYCDVYFFVLKVPNYSKVFKDSYFLVPFVTSQRVLAPLKGVGTALYGPHVEGATKNKCEFIYFFWTFGLFSCVCLW